MRISKLIIAFLAIVLICIFYSAAVEQSLISIENSSVVQSNIAQSNSSVVQSNIAQSSSMEQSNISETQTFKRLQFVDLTQPKEKDDVTWRTWIKGNSTATKKSGLSIWVLIWPIEVNGPWYVQPTTTFSDGSWQSYAYFGRNPEQYPEDYGTSYRVIAIMINETLSETLDELPDVPLSSRSQEVIVTRI